MERWFYLRIVSHSILINSIPKKVLFIFVRGWNSFPSPQIPLSWLVLNISPTQRYFDALFVITLHLSCQPVEGYSRSLPQWGNSSWSISFIQLLLLTRPKWRTGRESNPLKFLIAFVPVYRTPSFTSYCGNLGVQTERFELPTLWM